MQQTFSVGKKPRLVISQGRGNVTIRSWQEQSISVTAEGPIARLYQEGDTVLINGCESDLEVTIPYIKPWHPFAFVTNVSITDQNGSVFLENAGNVDLANISGDVELGKVEGNLNASNMPALREHKGIGENASFANISKIEVGPVGANCTVANAEIVVLGVVGASLDADKIGASLHCGSIGGNCRVQNSPNAELHTSNVGGSMHVDSMGIMNMQSCNVGGNLTMVARFRPGNRVQLMAGGNATLTLPQDANLSIHAMAGSTISGDALGSRKGGSFLNITYGQGASTLNITAGGSIRLLGNAVPSEESGTGFPPFPPFPPFPDFGREWGKTGKVGGDFFSAGVSTDMFPPAQTAPKQDGPRQQSGQQPTSEGEASLAQKREAILRMVAEGRITPDEGSMLLDALEK
jgi:hypothetical protein